LTASREPAATKTNKFRKEFILDFICHHYAEDDSMELIFGIINDVWGEDKYLFYKEFLKLNKNLAVFQLLPTISSSGFYGSEYSFYNGRIRNY